MRLQGVQSSFADRRACGGPPAQCNDTWSSAAPVVSDGDPRRAQRHPQPRRAPSASAPCERARPPCRQLCAGAAHGRGCAGGQRSQLAGAARAAGVSRRRRHRYVLHRPKGTCARVHTPCLRREARTHGETWTNFNALAHVASRRLGTARQRLVRYGGYPTRSAHASWRQLKRRPSG